MLHSQGLPRLVHDSAPLQPTLEGLRHEIDQLDDALLDLIERRIAASGAIARLKQSTSEGRLNLRPRRQAAIVERLATRARHTTPELIAHVWRELMSHSLQAQVRTEFVICASRQPEALRERVRERFGSAASIRCVSSPADALDAARQCEAVAVIEHDPNSDWWIALRNSDLLAFDRFAENGRLLAIIVGRVADDDVNDGPLLVVLDEEEIGARRPRGHSIETLSSQGELRLCLVSNAEAVR
ncbi:chorismate mutase [Enterovirga sp. GCM10030262]|uniref:chorismate mutase n=1 Tax=Enterovirga sp. GCM10030262 TaxID=3273391 RepID=UPI003612F946